MPLDEATKHTLRAFFAQDPHLSKQGAEKLCNDLALSCTPEQVYRWFANQRNKPDCATRKRYEAARQALMSPQGTPTPYLRFSEDTKKILRTYLSLQPTFTQAEVRAICAKHALPHTPRQVYRWFQNSHRQSAARAAGVPVSPRTRQRMDDRNQALRAARAHVRACLAWSEKCLA